MPSVPVRPIYQLNQELLLWGILPQIWMIGLAAIVGVSAIIIQPKGIGLLKVVVVAVVALAVLVPIHRVSRSRIIKHFIRWNDIGVGGLQGRDLNPVPLRYQEMTAEEEVLMREMRRKDLQRGAAIRRETEQMRREESKRQNLQPKEPKAPRATR